MRTSISSKIKRIFCYSVMALLVVIGVTYSLLRASLPVYNGEIQVKGLSACVRIVRDALGVPTIHAEHRGDIAFATGFIHAQERFFQMDLMRRQAAGELSELFGAKTVELDKKKRWHQLRKVSETAYTLLTPKEKELLTAYSQGVNEGIKFLKVKPFEYLLLNVSMSDWKPQDCLLVGMVLFLGLQDETGRADFMRGVMQTELPQQVYRFFTANGSRWDTPLDGAQLDMINIPQEEHFSYLENQAQTNLRIKFDEVLSIKGSNQFAVNGAKTADGSAILACDMHLGLQVPNIWYRAKFHYRDEDKECESTGATLPGTPLMIVGSNGHIAWGFTNAYVDTADIVYGRELKGIKQKEWIHVNGASSVCFEIEKTPFGPLIPGGYYSHPAALLWIGHEPSAINMRLWELETVSSARVALEKAKTIKTPLLNFLVADSKGHIGWTLIGALPNRSGFDGKLPIKYTQDFQGWRGLCDPDHYPSVYDPQENILVTANNRTMGGDYKEMMGINGFPCGIRAYQIRSRLLEKKLLDEKEMLSIQLDDEAIFFQRWKSLLISILSAAEEENVRFFELSVLLDNWNGHCSKDSSAYYWIRSFRNMCAKKILSRMLLPCFKAFNQFDLVTLDFEEPLWMIVSEKPKYLVAPRFKTWDEELLCYVKETVAKVPKNKKLSEFTWGKRNTLKIKHPLSDALPFLDWLLNMPQDTVSGDFCVPRVSAPRVGASERLVVSPGREDEAIFQMPTGQSGHPLSPHYKDHHKSWVEGLPDPLLPGEPKSTLVLLPES